MKTPLTNRKIVVIITLMLGFSATALAQSGLLAKGDKPDQQYRQTLYLLWSQLYPGKGNTFYCDYEFDNSHKRASQNGLNAEHVFPMSWVTNDLNCGTRKQCQANSADFRNIESDLHNIYPANVKANQARSSYRFANIPGENWINKSCDLEIDKKQRVAEPREAIRGEIARAMLYMEYQYELTLFAKNKALMQQWDAEDPPQAAEIERNQTIKTLQGRDNPFISRYPFHPND